MDGHVRRSGARTSAAFPLDRGGGDLSAAAIGAPPPNPRSAPTRTGRPRRPPVVRVAFGVALAASFFAVLALAAWAVDRAWPLPLPSEGAARIVLAHDGTPLWRFPDANGIWRHPVHIDEVSPLYLEALLGYEDRWFYHHPGVNPFAIARAAAQNLSSGRIVSGGSTLSMQVARLIDPHARSFGGKLHQLARTLQLETRLDKHEILTLYLNHAPFGGTLEGVAAASWTLLGKPPSHLTHAEAALLVVLPQAPSRLRPDRHPERAQAARDKVLRRMHALGVWPEDVVREALEEPVMLAPPSAPGLAPLFARRVTAEQALRNTPGNRIETTLDASLQHRVEALLHGWRANLPPRTSAAVLVVEHDTMAVRAYAGSADFGDDERFGHVDMVRAVRSPGSTLKPLLTGMALDAGLIHSESLLQDVPRAHSGYRPGNFASGFSGPVSAAEALARSLNLPAVQLLEAYGPRRFSAELGQAGVPLAVPPGAAPGLAIILGGAGTRLEDLVAGYRAFARDGRSARPRWLSDATETATASATETAKESATAGRATRTATSTPPDSSAFQATRAPAAAESSRSTTSPLTRHSLPTQDPVPALDERRLMSPAAAWVVRQTLLGRRASGQPLGMDAPAHPSLAWKTGTSYGFRDAWAIGVGPRHVIGVWVGRPDGTPVAAQFGVASAAPLLFQVHDLLSAGSALRHDWRDTPPAGVTAVDICWPGGQPLPDGHPDCRQRRRAWSVAGIVPPTPALTAHAADGAQLRNLWTDADGLQVAPDCPGAHRHSVLLWPAALDPWLPATERRTRRLPPPSPHCPPHTHPAPHAPLRIVGVRDGDQLRPAPTTHGDLTLTLSTQGGHGQQWWFHNGIPLSAPSPSRAPPDAGSRLRTPDPTFSPDTPGTSVNPSTGLDHITTPPPAITLHLDQAGTQQVSVIDESGQVAQVMFDVLGR